MNKNVDDRALEFIERMKNDKSLKSSDFEMKKGETITADVLLEMQKHDEDFQRRKAEQNAHFAALDAQYTEEEAEMVKELKDLGINVETSAWDLIEQDGANYKEGIPVLIHHLDQPYSERITEGIIRALTIEEARGAASPKILDMLEKSIGDELEFPLANSLQLTAAKNDVPRMQNLLEKIDDPMTKKVLQRAIKKANKLKE